MRNAIALVYISGLAASALSAPVIYNLGVFPGGTTTRGAAISFDGLYATGYGDVITTQTNSYAFRWSAAGGLVNLGVPLGQQNSSGTVINQNGTTIGGTSDGRFFRWTQSGGMQDIGVPGLVSSSNTVTGISSNGSILSGTCTLGDGSTRAYRWTPGPGYEILVSYPNNVMVNYANGYGMSADGSRVVGRYPGLQYGPFACYWDAAGMLTQMNGLSMYTSYATGISRNGMIAIGANGQGTFFRASGAWFSSAVDHGNFLGQFITMAATNYDGKVVVGWGGNSSNSAAYWSTALGTRDLNVLLPQLGANLTGWVLEQATGVSNDGSVIVGTGKFFGNTRAFVVTGVACPSVPVLPNLPPTARSVCPHPGAGTTVSLDVDAPGDVSYQWRVESPPDSGAFETITGPFFADASGQRFRVSGWEGPELTISDLQPAAGKPNITILPHVANPCGSAIVVPIQFVLCRADLDCNEQVDDADFVEFVAAYNTLLCPSSTPGLPSYCPGDLNSDMMVDDADFVIFASAYDALLCV